MMFKFIALFLLVISSFVSWARPNCYLQPFSKVKAKVIKVADGDTVKVILIDERLKETNPDCYMYRENVRLLYIDTPETHFEYNGGKFSQGHWGEVASSEMQGELPLESEVELVFGSRAQDNYGRFLAEVYYQERNLNLELVQKGLAFPIFFFPQVENAWTYVEANLLARKHKLGIFADAKASQQTPREFRISHSGQAERMYVGNIQTGEVVKGEDYKSVSAALRVYGRDYTGMKKLLAKYKNKIPGSCVALLN